MMNDIDKIIWLYNNMFPKVPIKHVHNSRNKLDFEKVIADNEKVDNEKAAIANVYTQPKSVQDKIANMYNSYNNVRARATCQNCGKYGYYNDDIAQYADVNNLLLCNKCYNELVHGINEV